MTTLTLAILLFIVGAVLLFGELLLPTGGILGVLAGLVILAGVVMCFMLDRWLGLAVFLAVVIASPFVGALMIRWYPKTPIGKRMILTGEQTVIRPPPVHIGQTGVAVTHLRPSGEAEFEDDRVEVISDRGIINAGATVRVIAIENGRPVVRTTDT